MNNYKHINIYQVLDPEFVEHIMRQELTDAHEDGSQDVAGILHCTATG